MTRFARFLLLSSALALGAIGFMGPAGAADRGTVAVVVAVPGAGAVGTAAPAVVTPATLPRRAETRRRSPTLNHQRPLNDDLARFTRAF